MEEVVTPTTATTGLPPATEPGELTVRQHLSGPRPSLAACVRERIAQLNDRGVRTFALADFEETAKRAGRPLPWVGDHLIVLEGVGVLRCASRSGERVWTISASSEYLR
jgi:hypothetical protein